MHFNQIRFLQKTKPTPIVTSSLKVMTSQWKPCGSRQAKLCRQKSQHDSLNTNKLTHRRHGTYMSALNAIQSVLKYSPPQMHRCTFPPFISYCVDKYNSKKKAVPQCVSNGTDQSHIPVLPMSWSVFSLSLFFISETAVNYWLTWVLITMQIWGKMKSKAAGSCHIPMQ